MIFALHQMRDVALRLKEHTDEIRITSGRRRAGCFQGRALCLYAVVKQVFCGGGFRAFLYWLA